jgi:hypothetical protein
MGARQLALLAALMILGCGDGAVASPPAPNLSSVSHFVWGEIAPVRWRYRYRRDYFWRGRKASSVAIPTASAQVPALCPLKRHGPFRAAAADG